MELNCCGYDVDLMYDVKSQMQTLITLTFKCWIFREPIQFPLFGKNIQSLTFASDAGDDDDQINTLLNIKMVVPCSLRDPSGSKRPSYNTLQRTWRSLNVQCSENDATVARMFNFSMELKQKYGSLYTETGRIYEKEEKRFYSNENLVRKNLPLVHS